MILLITLVVERIKPFNKFLGQFRDGIIYLVTSISIIKIVFRLKS